MLSHKEILTLIGEIDGITLRSLPNGAAVFLQINGKELLIIRDYGTSIEHTITRRGISDLIQDCIL